jgi:hypothetical protein
VNTLIPRQFKKFISKAMDEREKEYVVKKNMRMKAKPEFVELFENSGTISSK